MKSKIENILWGALVVLVFFYVFSNPAEIGPFVVYSWFVFAMFVIALVLTQTLTLKTTEEAKLKMNIIIFTVLSLFILVGPMLDLNLYKDNFRGFKELIEKQGKINLLTFLSANYFWFRYLAKIIDFWVDRYAIKKFQDQSRKIQGQDG